MLFKIRQLNMMVVGIAIICTASFGAKLAAAQHGYDFDKDILTVLRQRCFSCHAGEKREGDLWLDSRDSILLGGHTGSPLLGDVEESELIVRIESTEDGYRMPKEGPPLSAEQQRAFRNWVADGAPWPQAAAIGNANSKRQPPEEPGNFLASAGDWWLVLAKAYESPSWKYASWVVLPAAAVVFFVLLHRILFRRRQRLKGEPVDWPLLGSLRSFSAWVGLIGLAAWCAFLWGRVEENETQITRLEKLGPPKKQLQKTFGISFDQPPKVARPLHPKRLGGPYYRGNDERDPALFNNGFYRTANMNVQLIDGDGNPVDYDTPIDPQSLAIEFRFERAPGATEKLFLKRILKTGFISTSWGGTRKATDKVLFQDQGGADRWAVAFPLGLSGTGPFRNDLFVYYGPFERNRIHYQIHFDLKLEDDGTLHEDSEVWMGSAYNLSGRVITGNTGQILIDRWFDFRPIPEIEGENAASPELLGLPEHLE